MSDSEGVLSEEERIKIREYLLEKWIGNRDCNICGPTSWSIIGTVVTPVAFERKALSCGRCIPQIMVICETCGQILYFSSMFLGITPPDEKKKLDKKAEVIK